jgi:hypothetical protein
MATCSMTGGPERGCLLITAATNCSPQSAGIVTRLRELRAEGARALEDKIAAAAQAGELPVRTDAHALATFYAAVLQGMSAQARDGAARTDMEQIAGAALHACPSAAGQWTDAGVSAAPEEGRGCQDRPERIFTSEPDGHSLTVMRRSCWLRSLD